jgi:hypothetical protein
LPPDHPELGPCWLWTSPGSAGGYGSFYFRSKQWLAHRASYTILVGEIPAGLTIDHLCSVRSCVRPQHLEAVTLLENLRRANVWRRRAEAQKALTHCPHGHPYSGENLGVRKDGTRSCRASARRHAKQSRERRLAKNPPQPKPVKTHCGNGHAYSVDGYVGSNGSRCCHECDRIKLRRSRAQRKALEPPKPERTECGNGHPWVGENIYVNPKSRQRACRACHNERTLATYHATKQPKPPKPERTECSKGHPWIPENQKKMSGRLVCRACANEANRSYEARKRAEKNAQASTA